MNTYSIPAEAGRASNSLVTVSEVAEQVGREILESQLEPGAWATALYECGGKRQEALALYARLRVRKLNKQRRVRMAKVRSFESRRLANCMGDEEKRASMAKTIQEMLFHTRKSRHPLNFMKPRLSLLWMSILFVGTAGTAATLCRLLMKEVPDSFAHPLTLVALLAGVASVWAAMVLRYFLPKRWLMLGWNSGIIIACNVVCLSSLFLGTQVIKNSMVAQPTSAAAVLSTGPTPTAAVKISLPSAPYLVSTARKANPEN